MPRPTCARVVVSAAKPAEVGPSTGEPAEDRHQPVDWKSRIMIAGAGRFAEGDLTSIVRHLQRGSAYEDLTCADEAYSAQAGTGVWEGFGR